MPRILFRAAGGPSSAARGLAGRGEGEVELFDLAGPCGSGAPLGSGVWNSRHFAPNEGCHHPALTLAPPLHQAARELHIMADTSAYLGRNATRIGASPIQGRGLFAAMNLPGRRKLGEISGRLVKLPQARKAIEAAKRIYFIELTDTLALECSDGNQFKHLNHSCSPNCYLRVPALRVEVYTLRPVLAGEELTVDYGETPHKGGMRCTCGAPNCRGLL